MRRLCPTTPFPSYAFVPGQNPHPLKLGGHSYGESEPEPIQLSESNYLNHQEYLFALDLLNFGYYWESHVYFEAIWNAHQRAGDYANLCLYFIKIAAGKLKGKIGQDSPMEGHFKRAKEHLEKIENENIAGFKVAELYESKGPYFPQ